MGCIVKTYKRGARVRFRKRRGGKVLVGKIAGKWAPGEGDGYGIEVDDFYVDVKASNIIGLARS